MMYLFVQPLFIGTTELMLVAGIALLLFGGKKLPEMMRGMGKGIKEFKQGMNEPITSPNPSQGGEENAKKDADDKEEGEEDKSV